MDKDADNLFPLQELLRKRWSPRAFDPRPVEPEKLRSLLEAARWSASSGNQQPWRFMPGVNGDETFSCLFESLDEGNKIWNKRTPVLLLSISKTTYGKNDKPNPYHQFDLGASMAYLAVQATAMGLFIHQMGGFSAEKVISGLAIPEPYQPVTIAAIGYAGDPESLDAFNLRREMAPRERMPFSDFVFSGKFGEPSSLFTD